MYQVISQLAMFTLPLILWLAFAAARFGIAEAINQLTTIAGFIGLVSYSHQEFQPLHQLSKLGSPLSITYLISRLQDPLLEWSHPYYTLGTKLKVIALSLGSVVVTLFGLYMQRPADRRPFTTLASLALLLMVLAYTYWWFMLHPTMWMRHFTPALYIGLGLWIFGCYKYRCALRCLNALSLDGVPLRSPQRLLSGRHTSAGVSQPALVISRPNGGVPSHILFPQMEVIFLRLWFVNRIRSP